MNLVYLYIFLINLKKRESKRSWEDAVALTDKTIVLMTLMTSKRSQQQQAGEI